MEPDPRELELVRRAISEGVTGCCEWNGKEARSVERDPELSHYELTPKWIKLALIDYVRKGGLIEQQIETREEKKVRFDYWYRANIPIQGFPKPLFVEIRFLHESRTLPVVSIVHAHF